jgi:hypothetical protein
MNMRTWVIVTALAGAGLVLFLLPHHRGYGSGASLAQTFGEFFTGSWEGIESTDALVMAGLLFVGSVGVLLPALLALTAALAPDGPAPKVLIIGGLVLVAAGALTLFVETASNLLLGFGGGSMYPETTVVAYLAPSFPIVCGVGAIIVGRRRLRMRRTSPP